MELEDEIKPIHSPKEAVAQLVGEQFIEWLLAYVKQEVKRWPSLVALRTVQVPLDRLRRFMLQRFLAAEAFWGGREGDPGFLGFAIANLSEVSDPTAEGALSVLEKKRREDLSQQPDMAEAVPRYRQLWFGLLTALGVSEEEIVRGKLKEAAREYIAELSDIYSNSEWQEAMGAFATGQQAEPLEYSAIVAMLGNNTLGLEVDLLVFQNSFGRDTKYVAGTAQVLEKIVFDQLAKQLIFQGAERELAVRQQFYNRLFKILGTGS